VILVPPSLRSHDHLSFVLPTVTSQKGCGKYVSVSDCVVRPSEVAGENVVSVTKQEGLALDLRVNGFGRRDIDRVVFR